MVRIQEPKKGQLTITVPAHIARLTGWKKGDELIMVPGDGEIILRRLRKDENRY
jgi:AbrB family looped-hinge helix DNA binding protein